MTFATLMTQVARFNNETTARSYATRAANRHIVLGDNGEYWVASARYASKLVKLGYSYAN